MKSALMSTARNQYVYLNLTHKKTGDQLHDLIKFREYIIISWPSARKRTTVQSKIAE